MPLHLSVQAFLRARAESRMARTEADHQASVEAGVAYVEHMRARRQEAEARLNCKPHVSIEASTQNAPAPLEPAGGMTQGETP